MSETDPILDIIQTRLGSVLPELLDAYAATEHPGQASDFAPPLLADAFQQLLEAMRRTEVSLGGDAAIQDANHARAEDVTELGEYALKLFDQTLEWSRRLQLSESFRTLQDATTQMALWIARHGGHLLAMEPVVDALAQSANRTQDTAALLTLYQAMGEIMDATAPAIQRDLEKTNPGRPWRLLHLNRAIVATRTHQPDFMEEAFARLTADLPGDAAQFFSEGMKQMELLDYPPHVREVMDRYYQKWSVDRSLH